LIYVIWHNVYSAKGVKLVDVPYIISRAKALAGFVARQMCGLYPGIASINGHLEIHLRYIKKSLETSIIPLGQLRAGSYLERALLFKAMADRLCLPVALVRGEYGISWIEIAIPQVILYSSQWHIAFILFCIIWSTELLTDKRLVRHFVWQ